MRYPATFLLMCMMCLAPSMLRAELSAAALIASSPFLHEGWDPNSNSKTASTSSTYMFRGVYSLMDEVKVNIADNTKKKTYWLKEGESRDGIHILSYDDANRRVTLSIAGREMTLDLEKPKSNATPVGKAVNSLANKRKRRPPPFFPGKKANGQDAGSPTMPPPPPWVNKVKNQKAASSGVGSSSSSSSSSSDDDSASSDDGTDTGSDSPVDDDSGDDDSSASEEESFPTPPAAPDFTPPAIPDYIKNLMNDSSS